MKYVVKVEECQNWTTWYTVEANSGDEAMELVFINGKVIEEEFSSYDRQILEIEPYNEN